MFPWPVGACGNVGTCSPKTLSINTFYNRYFPDGFSLDRIQAHYGQHFNIAPAPRVYCEGFFDIFSLPSGSGGAACQGRPPSRWFSSVKRLIGADLLPWEPLFPPPDPLNGHTPRRPAEASPAARCGRGSGRGRLGEIDERYPIHMRERIRDKASSPTCPLTGAGWAFWK